MELKKKIDVFFNNLELSLSLAKADFKLRNEGSYLGILWYLLEPLLFFIIILSMGGILGIKTIDYYPLYLLLGLIMFNFFSGATLKSSRVIVNNSAIIKSIKIPYESLVISEVIQSTFSHMFEIILFIMFMIFFRIPILNILFYFMIFIFFFLFILGFSFIFSTLGAYINDLDNVWLVITRLLWFMTPIFYVSSVNDNFYVLNMFNPMFYFITIARGFVIYNQSPQLWVLLTTILFSLIFLIFGYIIFNKFKNKFSELV